MNFGTMELPVLSKEPCLIGAGSYLLRPDGTVGIKLAKEIDLPADAVVELRDMAAPYHGSVVDWQMHGALLLALYSLARGRAVYAGCMGGYGRTGVFLACLAKCFGVESPVAYVRATYHERAVETDAQEDYVRQFDPGALRVAVAGARLLAGWK